MANRACSIDGCNKRHEAKGYCPMHYRRWRTFGDPLKGGKIRRSVGSGEKTAGGYIVHTVNGKRIMEHRLVVERILGKQLPSRCEVHHVDGDGLNNSPTNLVVCPDRDYHQLLHRRQRALEKCGRPGWRPCRFCCQYDDPKNLYIAPNGKQAHHRECCNSYHRERRKQ